MARAATRPAKKPVPLRRATVVAIRSDRSTPVRVVIRAVTILDWLSRVPSGVGISDLSGHTGMSKSTLHNILQTLVATGLAVADPQTKRYRLGPKPTEWSGAFLESLDIGQLAGPQLEQLRDLTGETAAMYVRTGDARVCVARMQSTQPIRRVPELGEIHPLWLSSTGRVLMSGMSDEAVEAFLRRADLGPATKHTLTDRRAILDAVRAARRLGYSMAEEEVYADVASIAVAVHDRAGDVVACLAVSGPVTRWNRTTMTALLPRILESAADLSRRMGRPKDLDGLAARQRVTKGATR